MRRTGRQSILQIYKLMSEYPDAKVICMVGEEAVPYEYASQLASFGSVTYDHYLMSGEYGLDEDRIYFKTNEEVEYVIDDYFADNKTSKADQEKIKADIESNWVECIVVGITSA